MKILFVCKYNRFRSQVAEASFRKLNKNKKIKFSSAGMFQGYPIAKVNKTLGKELGIEVKGKPRCISERELVEVDLIVITANNVPKDLFEGRAKKVIVWKIRDCSQNDEKNIRKIMKDIYKKSESLVKLLRNKK